MKRSLLLSLLLPLAGSAAALADVQDPPRQTREQRQQDGAQRQQDGARQGKKAQEGRAGKKAQEGGQTQGGTAGRQDPRTQGKAGVRIDATAIHERARAARADIAAEREARERNKERSLLVRNFFGEVKQHRVRLAQLERLEGIFTTQGEDDRVARVQALRQQQQGAWVKILARYRRELGDEHFNAFRKRVGALLEESK